jgi:uncharacterized secreted protein with C-terminal beta-propeller domain
MVRTVQTVLVVTVAVACGILLAGTALFALDDGAGGGKEPVPFDGAGEGVTTFDSDTAYRSYLQRGQARSQSGWFGFGGPQVAVEGGVATDDVAQAGRDTAASASAQRTGDDGGGTASGPDRYSKTNVQVTGVQEPDILKTDGNHVYYAGYDRFVGYDRYQRGGANPGTVLDAADPAAPAVAGAVPASGTYLLAGDTLVVIGEQTVSGYDVSEPATPQQQWTRSLNHSVDTARLLDGTVYLVLADRPDPATPCPIRPMGETGPGIECSEVYRPASGEGGDTTYSALSIDPESGAVGDTISFVGSGENTVVYVSEDAIYLSYEQSRSAAETRLAYLFGPGSEHLDETTLDRLREIESYELTPQAAMTEIRATVQASLRRQPDTDSRQLEADFQTFLEEHKRDIVQTGIVRIGVDGQSLGVEASNTVPGRLLNQFSMGERDGYLQVATTTNPGGAKWVNDLYTLDADLEIADSITGMGTEQRIYSVRYVEDRAYIVTYRQIDPFYVIDTTDPTDLELKGELKLPGYSGYMHSLGDDRILGIGQEDGRVKATIFDASDPENPVVEDDAVLDDRWSAVSQSHHAFLLDAQNEVFFLPGSEGGHIYSYSDGLERVTTVTTNGAAVRALYIDQYMYVFGTEEVAVVDQTDYSVVDRTSIQQSVPADATGS